VRTLLDYGLRSALEFSFLEMMGKNEAVTYAKTAKVTEMGSSCFSDMVMEMGNNGTDRKTTWL
jgi:hypothetical protein